MLRREEIDALLARHGVDPARALGQNFVADPSVVERVAAEARVGPRDVAVEVGPGLGSLTLALAATGAAVLAVEKDPRLLPLLDQVLSGRDVLAPGPGVEPGRVVVTSGDAVDLDWDDVLVRHRAASRPARLVANLPYNVAVPIVMSVLTSAPTIDRLVVMVQKEVAERLVAGPGGRVVGIPSMRVAWYAHAHIAVEVPPEVFVPRPRVTSAVVVAERRPPPATDVDVDEVFALVELAYRHRRKMLRSTLGRAVDPGAFDSAGIDSTRRPEELSIHEWAALARAAGR